MVTYARFSLPVGMQLLFKREFEHAIITCHCEISGNAEYTYMYIHVSIDISLPGLASMAAPSATVPSCSLCVRLLHKHSERRVIHS